MSLCAIVEVQQKIFLLALFIPNVGQSAVRPRARQAFTGEWFESDRQLRAPRRDCDQE